jgi:exosortase
MDSLAALAGPAWLAFAVLATLPLFAFGLTGLAEAWSRPEFSHGPVIPCLSFYMFLHELKAVPPASAPVTDRWPGILVVAAALALATLGNLVQIDDLVFYALIVWTAGLILVGFGWRRGVVFWPSVLHLVFMLPLPQFLYWQVNTTLQFLSSEVGVGLVRLAGVPVFLDGNVIDLGVYKLQVAEACSGLRYLFPIMSFTYVFAVLYRGPVWHKLVLLLSAVPLAVLMNSVRIGIIGVLVANFFAVPILVGTTVDAGVYLVHSQRHGDANRTLKQTRRACLLCGLTTLLGFGALVTASHRGVVSLGMILVIGCLAGILASYFVVPAILGWFNERGRRV